MSKKAIEIVCDNRKKLVDKIVERLEEGHNIWKLNWKPSNLLPQNPVSNVKYKGINRFILGFTCEEKGYDDPRWITMKQAIEKGYKLKDNQEPIICEKWIWEKKVPDIDEKTGEQKIDEKGNKIFKIEELSRPICNYFKVYNAKQFIDFPELEENINLMEDWKNDEKQMKILNIADNFINSSKCLINEVNRNTNAYSPVLDEIFIVPRKQFKSAEDFLGTVLHEMSHSTGHETRLNRGFGKEVTKNKEYAMEELIAELSTTFLEAELGINLEFENTEHLDYLGSWIETLKEDPNILYKICKEASMASEYLFENYQLELEKTKDYEEEI